MTFKKMIKHIFYPLLLRGDAHKVTQALYAPLGIDYRISVSNYVSK